MPTESYIRTRCRALYFACLSVVVLIGAAGLPGEARAQQPAGDSEPQAGATAGKEPASQAVGVAQPAESAPRTALAPKGISKGKPESATKRRLTPRGVKRVGRSSFAPDPNAKWACAKRTVELDPVWRGHQQLTFAFDIKNEGTADLRIRAKGG